MNILSQIIHNEMFMGTLLAWFAAQLLKTLINWIENKKFDKERIFGCGGFPSSHSSTVSALATTVGINCGFGGYEFALAFAFGMIVIYDALNVRLETGKQSVVINHLLTAEEIRDILLSADKDKRTKAILKEYVGHTPTQIVAGIIIGVLVGWGYCALYV